MGCNFVLFFYMWMTCHGFLRNFCTVNSWRKKLDLFCLLYHCTQNSWCQVLLVPLSRQISYLRTKTTYLGSFGGRVYQNWTPKCCLLPRFMYQKQRNILALPKFQNWSRKNNVSNFNHILATYGIRLIAYICARF